MTGLRQNTQKEPALRAPACQTSGPGPRYGSAGGTNKGTGQDKEDPHQIT